MKRRDFVKISGISVAGLGVDGASDAKAYGRQNSYKPKGSISPNAEAKQIVFIMTDTQRWDMVGHVNADMKTPWLDRMAKNGMRFDLNYSTSPVCGPARSTLFTGTYPHTNGVFGNNLGLADNVRTIGERLSDNGFHCGYMGKWHLDGTDYFGNGICPAGWDPEYWYDMRMYLEELSEKDQVRSRLPHTNEDRIDADFTYAHRVSNRALDFVEKHQDKPFFMVASYDEPHHPFLCPEPYASMYKDYEWPQNASHYDDLKNKPRYQQLWAEGRQNEDKDAKKVTHPYFFGCNSFVDFEIGRVVQKVEQTCPDALIIYTSDHGDFLNAHSLKSKGPCIYDDVARVPLLVQWKDKIKKNTICNHPVSQINIVPTILEAAGMDIPDFIQGKSILKTLKHPAHKTQDEVFIEFGYFEVNHDGFGGYQPLRAVFDGRYKLSINLMSTDELYDLKTDPYEVNNLIDSEDHIQIRSKLHRKILDHMGTTRDPFRGIYWEDRSWNPDFEPTWEYTHTTRSRKDDGYYPRVKDYNTGQDVKEYVRVKELDKKK